MTGDNGMPFPRAKGTCYDPGIQVPLIARWPRRIQPGQVCDDLIAHIDLPATWLDAAGVAKPAKMQGRSFLPRLEGRPYEKREAVFSERNWHDNFDPIRSARTDRYKLIFNASPHFPYRPAWDLENSPTWASIQREARRGKLARRHLQLLNPARPIIELYDLERDPGEFHNLSSDPGHEAVLNDLMRRLSDWMHDTYDYLPPAFARPGEPAGRNWPVSL
jgi:arylsulfatase A-like enzyme